LSLPIFEITLEKVERVLYFSFGKFNQPYSGIENALPKLISESLVNQLQDRMKNGCGFSQ
jgi:hypothetical protein